jgi:hypothetical protein
MSGGIAQRIEAGVDAGAAALLGGAVLLSASKLSLPLLLAGGWALLTAMLVFWFLGSMDSGHPGFSLSPFSPTAFQPDPPELLLDDVLPDVGQDSRVVRLFDASAAPQAAPPDASHALYDALAQLRRSLR